MSSPSLVPVSALEQHEPDVAEHNLRIWRARASLQSPRNDRGAGDCVMLLKGIEVFCRNPNGLPLMEVYEWQFRLRFTWGQD
jgi:hypothetical protein